MRTRSWLAFGGACLAIAGWASARAVGCGAHAKESPSAQAHETPPIAFIDAGESDEDDKAYAFRVPAGEPAALACDAARSVIAQARGNLAYEAEPVLPKALATGAADWLDPHGLWSAAPDSPVALAMEKNAPALLRELDGASTGDCPAAREVGRALVLWVADLAARFDKERASASAVDVTTAAGDSMFEGGSLTRSAMDLAALLGQRVGAVEHAVGPDALPFAAAARARFFPAMNADAWGRVVLAAEVRAYVQLVDPHGAWAPFDEEASVYEVDLESHPPERLWEKATRTAIGVRIESEPRAPLHVGDVVLAIGGMATAGLPLEQVDQLDFAAAGQSPTTAVLLRAGETALSTVTVTATEEALAAPPSVRDDLPVDRIPYGTGDVLVVAIHDVRDDLGDELTRALLRERERSGRALLGLVIDLRGNGGGSTEGAIAALGLFLPGAPLFPMKRRDGTIETDRAPEPPNIDRWTEPVATLVDGDTASAAEMIAGAIAVYRRGPTVGTMTYGKGCAQEYIDDDARAGVLRLTTLLYALPDGAPVQRVGLAPTILLPWSSPVSAGSTAPEREATLTHAPPMWRGPDVRERLPNGAPGGWTSAWPSHGGGVGPCKDGDVCRALRALGNTPPKHLPTAKAR